MTPSVKTVLGEISPDELGITLTHEHFAVDATRFRKDPRVKLDDTTVISEELTEFKELGGGAVVDLTPIDLGRDPHALQVISRQTGLPIVMATSFYYEVAYPDFVRESSVEQIAGLFIKELTEGVGETGIRCGVIGEIGTSGGAITRDEEKVFRAAAIAQRQTGAAINTHTYWAELGLEQIALLREAGGDISRTVIGHLDLKMDLAYHLSIAETGATVAYDCLGKTYYDAEFGVQFASDEGRADAVLQLVRSGHAGRVVLSHDVCKTSQLRRNGGNGYAHLLREFVPLLRERGIGEDDLHTILVDTPARLLAF
jgi:phosphotriesterase-related protein